MAKLKPGPGKQNRHKRYKEQGRRELNKRKKAERHKKRMQRFADRREAGKTYEYDKERTEQKRKWNKDHPNDRIEIGSNINSNKGRHTEFAKQDSINAFLKKEAEAKQKEYAMKAAEKARQQKGDSDV